MTTTNWKNVCIGGRPVKSLCLNGRNIWKKLPYDAEVEYLHPTLLAYPNEYTTRIDTGISPTKDTEAIVDFSVINMNGGEVVREFIPVRFTNERGETEGVMYDKVSKQLFRNAGTGAFVIGPDKAN